MVYFEEATTSSSTVNKGPMALVPSALKSARFQGFVVSSDQILWETLNRLINKRWSVNMIERKLERTMAKQFKQLMVILNEWTKIWWTIKRKMNYSHKNTHVKKCQKHTKINKSQLWKKIVENTLNTTEKWKAKTIFVKCRSRTHKVKRNFYLFLLFSMKKKPNKIQLT